MLLNKKITSISMMLVFALALLNFIMPKMVTNAAAAVEVIKIEGEDSTAYTANFTPGKAGKDYTADTFMSNGDMMQLHTASLPAGQTEFHITYQFAVSTSGEYNLDMACNFPASIYVSPYDIKVNNGDYMLVTSGNTTDNGTIGGGFAPNVHKLQLKSTFALQAGTNTITFRVNQFRASDKARYDLFIDYFKFTRIGIEAELSKNIIDFTNNESSSISVSGVMPLKQANDFAGCTTTYTSADPAIAVVDSASGIITAVGGGVANIRARVESGTSSVETYMPITVTVNNLQVGSVVFEDSTGQKLVKYSGESYLKGSVLITNYSLTETREATLILLLRDSNQIVKKAVASKISINPNEIQRTLSTELIGLPTGGYFVDAFVLDNLDGMLPVTGITQLKQ